MIGYFWTDEFPQSQASVRKHAPDARWVELPSGEPQAYPRSVAEIWAQDELITIEQDIVITGEVIQSLTGCSEPWCVFTYDLGSNGYPMRYGLGCTRFSLDLQKRVSYDRVLAHKDSGCEWCQASDDGVRKALDCQVCPCYRHQDAHLRHELMKEFGPDVVPHVHGHVRHLHDFTGTAMLVTDAAGNYVWIEGTDHREFASCQHCRQPIFRWALAEPGPWQALQLNLSCPGGEHSPARSCSQCGGPIRPQSRYGICSRNPDCERARQAAMRSRFIESRRERDRDFPRDPTYQAAYLGRVQDETLATADRHHHRWTDDELALLEEHREELTVRELAVLVGRTYWATTNRLRRNERTGQRPSRSGNAAQETTPAAS